jgi:outer membrane protein
MTRITNCFIAVVAAFFLTAGTGLAADMKIGVVDVQKVLMESDAGKEAQSKITSQGKEMEGKLKTQGEAIEEMQKKLEKEKLVMSPEQFETKQREVRTKVINFKDQQRNFLEDLKKSEAKALSVLRDDILSVIDEIGKAEGYSIVVQRSDVLFFKPDMDITAQVISGYNKKYSSKKK